MLTTLLTLTLSILPFSAPDVHISDGSDIHCQAKWVQPGVSPVPVFKVEVNGVSIPEERLNTHNDGNVVHLYIPIPLGTQGRVKVTATDNINMEVRHIQLVPPLP